MNVWFVTGTDTDAGKTLVTSGLLYAARQQQLSTLGLKPIASGSQATPEGLRNSDALALQHQSVPPVDYATVNPIAFAPAVAPHLAAFEAGKPLEISAIVSLLRKTLESCSLNGGSYSRRRLGISRVGGQRGRPRLCRRP